MRRHHPAQGIALPLRLLPALAAWACCLLPGAARAASEPVLEAGEVILHAQAACDDPNLPPPSAGQWDVPPSWVVPGRVLVALEEPLHQGAMITGRDADGCAVTGVAAVDALSHGLGLRRMEAPFIRTGDGRLDRIARLEFDESVDPRVAAEVLAAQPGVLWAEPDHLRFTDAVPSDSSWFLQWNMHITDAPRAWDLETGDPSVIIAVIDTGIQLNHPDLQDNIWRNPAEDGGVPNFDDDGNGYEDDFIGWDFIDVAPFLVAQGEDAAPPDNLPLDNQGHGTSVAGVVGAPANNASPISSNVAGACWGCSIMALRAGYKDGATGTGVIPASASAGAIVYAADNGASIINMSYSSPVPSMAEEAALAYAVDRGLLPVAAAGNIRDPNTAGEPVYPAAHAGVVAVAATDKLDTKATFSKYGTYVDLSAPGQQIFSTRLPSAHGFHDGTSFAAPLVAGIAGLVLSSRPGLEGADLEALLKASAVEIDSRNIPFQGLLGEGRVDAFGALVAHRIAVTNLVTDPNTPSAAFSVTGVVPDPNAPWVDFPVAAPLAVVPGDTVYVDAVIDESEAECGINLGEVRLQTDSPAAGETIIPVALRLDCDADNDGYLCEARGGLDCDDALPGVSPSAGEVCDGAAVCQGLGGTDDNCDGLIDEICSCSGKPNAPEIVSLKLEPGPAVRLVWKDLSNNEKGFKIHKRKRPKGKWRKVARLAADSTAYVDLNLKPGTIYQYRVKAFKKGGKGNKVITREILVP